MLGAVGAVASSALSWVGPLVLVTGLVRSLELVISGIDFYKVTKFKKGMLNCQNYGSTLAYLNNKENAKNIKKAFGVSQKELIEALSRKGSTLEEQNALLNKLKGRITATRWSIAVDMSASAVSAVASLVFVAAFLAPIVFPPAIVAVPILMGTATGIMLTGAAIVFGKFVADVIIDYKFKKALGIKLF